MNPDLVARDDQGKVYTVRYEAVNAMLLNEFLKEHRKVEALESTVAHPLRARSSDRPLGRDTRTVVVCIGSILI